MERRLALAALAWTASALAQAPAPPPPPAAPPIKSCEVHPDRRVTFRLRAPKASDVTLRGDWMAGSSGQPLAKDNEGVWSVTLGPLDPDIYSYSLVVDGLTIVDPVNPNLKLGVRAPSSYFEVPGGGTLPHEVRDIPHGAVETNWYRSVPLGDTRRFEVYTPPDYYKGSTRYPVLYLFHGGGDTEREWALYGRANIILDNLIAAGKAKPMLIVMPFGHAAPPGDPTARGRNTPLFEEDLLKSVMPAVEAKYRVAPGANNRAIAGLSMGGGQTLHITLLHPDRFAWAGVFSMGAMDDFEDRYAKALADAGALNKNLKLFWIACGKNDFLYQRALRLDELLTKHGVKHEFKVTEGAHTWMVWRRYLAELAPRLFQE